MPSKFFFGYDKPQTSSTSPMLPYSDLTQNIETIIFEFLQEL